MVDQNSVTANIVDALCTGLGDRLVAVLLYGSRARGSVRADSDWDILVIARDLPDRALPRHVLVKRLLPAAIRGAVSISARTPDEIVAATPLPSLYHDIAIDARVLYDPIGFAERWLTAARHDIEAGGLWREETPYGLAWRRSASTVTDGRR